MKTLHAATKNWCSQKKKELIACEMSSVWCAWHLRKLRPCFLAGRFYLTSGFLVSVEKSLLGHQACPPVAAPLGLLRQCPLWRVVGHWLAPLVMSPPAHVFSCLPLPSPEWSDGVFVKVAEGQVVKSSLHAVRVRAPAPASSTLISLTFWGSV